MLLLKKMVKNLDEKDFVDTMIKDGLWDAFNGYHMGMTAENVASKWKISRKDQDDFALLSQSLKLKKHKKTEISKMKLYQ